MATTTEAGTVFEPTGGPILFRGVDWDDYEKMLQIVGDRHLRVTYDMGTTEVSMPSQRHERLAQRLGLFVPKLAVELEIAYEPLGMTTWRRPDLEKGIESDQCYYIRNQAIVREREELDLEVDPPPDLAIEVDYTSSSLDRLAIYAELGVPEVWRYEGQKLTILQLQADRRYQPCETSLSFPGLRPADVERFIELSRAMDKLRWVREIRDWVRNVFIPRRYPGERPN